MDTLYSLLFVLHILFAVCAASYLLQADKVVCIIYIVGFVAYGTGGISNIIICFRCLSYFMPRLKMYINFLHKTGTPAFDIWHP